MKAILICANLDSQSAATFFFDGPDASGHDPITQALAFSEIWHTTAKGRIHRRLHPGDYHMTILADWEARKARAEYMGEYGGYDYAYAGIDRIATLE